MENNDLIHCPHCNSTHVTANKKGFSGGKAAAGALLTGGIGLLAGTIGSKKIIITCLNCGKQFRPGQGAKPAGPQPRLIWDENLKQHVLNPNYKQAAATGGGGSAIVALIVLVIVMVVLFKACTG